MIPNLRNIFLNIQIVLLNHKILCKNCKLFLIWLNSALVHRENVLFFWLDSSRSWRLQCCGSLNSLFIFWRTDLQRDHVGSVLPPDAEVVHQELEHVERLILAHVQQQDSGHKADPLAVADLCGANNSLALWAVNGTAIHTAKHPSTSVSSRE